LAVIERETSEHGEVLARHGLREQLAVVASARQLARDLSGRTPGPSDGRGVDYDDRAALAELSKFGARHFAHACRLLRAQSLYLWGRIDEAAAMLREAALLAPESKGMLHSAEHVFLHALVTAAGPAPSLRDKLSVWRAGRQLQAWAERCPSNFNHKAALVQAEALRMRGRDRAARESYARAASLAAQHGYMHVEGMAHLLASRLGHAQEAKDAALDSFQRWGASALVQSLRSHGDAVSAPRHELGSSDVPGHTSGRP
jgi:tetratricopeptide (TPR) repeat protein